MTGKSAFAGPACWNCKSICRAPTRKWRGRRLRDEGFADPFTKDAALALFQHGNVLVITNDDGLAWDLLSQRSVKSRYRLHVAAVSSHGWLRKPKAFYELQEYKAWRAERNRRQEAEKNEERRGL